MVTFLKRTSNDFPEKDKFNKLPILDMGDLRLTSNYTSYYHSFAEQIKTIVGPRQSLMLFVMLHPQFKACAKFFCGKSLQLTKSFKNKLARV
jgi:hypothetical protein